MMRWVEERCEDGFHDFDEYSVTKDILFIGGDSYLDVPNLGSQRRNIQR